MTRRTIVGLVLLLILAASAWYVFQPAYTPAPQPALQTLAAKNFSDFEKGFDDAASSVRIILLLSPT